MPVLPVLQVQSTYQGIHLNAFDIFNTSLRCHDDWCLATRPQRHTM